MCTELLDLIIVTLFICAVNHWSFIKLFQFLQVVIKVVVTLVTSHTCNLLIQKSGTYIVASAILSVVIVIGIQNASVMEWHLVFFQHFQM